MRASLGFAVSQILLVGVAACGGVPDSDGSLPSDEDSAGNEGVWPLEGEAIAISNRARPAAEEPVGTVTSAATAASRAFLRSELLSMHHPVTGSNSYNSRGGSNSVVRNSVGTYIVTFGNILTYHGTPHVVGFGPASSRCQLAGLVNRPTAMDLHVNCYNPAGTKVDSLFVASYDDSYTISPSQGGDAYAFNGSASGSSYSPVMLTHNPPGNYEVYFARWGIGLYIATFTNLNSFKGTFHVTPYGPNPRTCQIHYWTVEGSDTVVSLSCHRPGGDKGDSMFTIRYMDQFGADDWDSENGFAWASDTTTVSYSPHSNYNWNTAADSNLVNTAGNQPNYQWIEFPSFPTTLTNRKVTGLVTAYAGAGAQIECHPRSWSGNRLNIACTDKDGNLVKSWHTAWFGNHGL